MILGMRATYSWLYTEALYHGFILGFILGFTSLGRGVSIASVASSAVLVQGVVQGGRSTPGHHSALFFALYMLYTPLRVCISVCLYSTQSIETS